MALVAVQDLIHEGAVIPVIVIHHLEDAVPLAQALVAGGVRVLEVTLRTPVALAAIREIVAAVPQAIVGAGTVRTAADVQAAKAAGCQFAVSPGWTVEIAQACQDVSLPLLPGVMTPSEVMRAFDGGCRFLKFFPAASAGGVAMLKAFQGPFADVIFCPTGGITQATAPTYLGLANVPVCGGSWLTPDTLVREGDWAGITRLALETRSLRNTLGQT